MQQLYTGSRARASKNSVKNYLNNSFEILVVCQPFSHKMVNETTSDTISTCFGFEMVLRIDKDDALTVHYAEVHKYGVLSYSLAGMNCGLNVLLGVIAIFYNTKILTNVPGRRRKWKFSNIALWNLAVADVIVGFIILPSRALLLVAALQGEVLVCQGAVKMLFKSLQIFLSTASFHGVVIVTIERYISVIHCMKCTIIMTKVRMVSATLTAWFVSSSFGVATLLTAPRTIQLVLSIHIISVCIIIGVLNVKMHLVAKAQRTRICLQRRSVHCTERHPIKKYLKMHKSVAMVITTITLCYVPGTLISLISFMGFSPLVDLIQPWSTTLFFAASSLNPFVYFKKVKKSAFSRKRAIYVSPSSTYYNGCNV